MISWNSYIKWNYYTRKTNNNQVYLKHKTDNFIVSQRQGILKQTKEKKFLTVRQCVINVFESRIIFNGGCKRKCK